MATTSDERLWIYVGERYLPGATPERAVMEAGRIGEAASTLAGDGFAVRLLSCTFVPHEEWMLDLFVAGTASEVELVYARARVSPGRLSEAIHFPNEPSPNSEDGAMSAAGRAER